MKHIILFAGFLAALTAGSLHETKLQQGIHQMETKGDLPAAIKLFEEAAAGADRNVAARALLYLGDCRAKLGNDESRKAYERVLREFADQRETASEAQARLAAQRGPYSPVMTTRQVWTGRKVDPLGTVSPDGRYLSFVDWDTGDMAVRDLAAGTDRRLTNKGSWTASDEFAEESSISPDGKRVAYSWFNKDFRYELRLANLTGDPNPRRLFDSEEVDWLAPYHWTPDGKWIPVQVQRKDRTTQIGLISSDTGALRVLKSVDWRGPQKIFPSPDGNYLAYDLHPNEASEQRDIYLIALDGSSENHAVAHPANDVVMGWSPDGSMLLFGSDRTGSHGVWALPISGGKPAGAPQLVKPDIGDPWSVGLTRAGAMYFSVRARVSELLLASVDLNSGKLLAPAAKPVQTHVGSNIGPAFSPDGKYMSYLSRRQNGRTTVLGLVSLATGEVRELRPALLGGYSPRWTPDSKHVVVQSRDRRGRQGIYRIDVQTGEVSPLLLSDPGVYTNAVGLSPDGSTLYYRRNDPKATNDSMILARDLSSGAERELLRGKDIFPGDLSPDGRFLTIKQYDRKSKTVSLSMVPVAGGNSKELVKVKDPEGLFTGTRWTPDGRSVLFLKVLSESDSTPELWTVPVEGGQPRKVDLPFDGIRQVVLHPDGRRIAFLSGDNRTEIWVMENFLPSVRASR